MANASSAQTAQTATGGVRATTDSSVRPRISQCDSTMPATITVTTTQRGIFGNRTSQQTYNVPTNNGQPLPGATKADYDRADRYLHELADKTGGRLYEANDTNQLSASFTRIAEELRRQYTIGYYPKAAAVADGELRQIRVRVRQPNLAVKARNSYVKPNSGSQNQ